MYQGTLEEHWRIKICIYENSDDKTNSVLSSVNGIELDALVSGQQS